MPGLKTNETAGTRAVLRHYRMSAYKARQVLDLVRGQDVDRAEETLRSTPREAARVVEKVLASAVANARNNDLLDPDELYVSACYADEGTTLKRWRPRARGRATRIRKRTCHITVIVSRLPEDRLERRRARQSDATTALRARRVAASRREARRGAAAAEAPSDDAVVEDLDDAAPEDVGESEVDEDVETVAAAADTDAEPEVDEDGDEESDAPVLETADATADEDGPAPAPEAASAEKAAPAEKAEKAAPVKKAAKTTKAARKTTKKSAGTTDAADGDGDDGPAGEEKD